MACSRLALGPGEGALPLPPDGEATSRLCTNCATLLPPGLAGRATGDSAGRGRLLPDVSEPLLPAASVVAQRAGGGATALEGLSCG